MCINRIFRKLYGSLPKGNKESYGFEDDAMLINLTRLWLQYPANEFSKEYNHEMRFFAKLLGFFACLFCTVMCLVLFPPLDILAFLTNWTVLTNLFQMCLSIGMQIDRHTRYKKEQELGKGRIQVRALYHMVVELNAGLNLIVILIYWGAIHATEIKNFEGMQRAHMYWVHIMP